MGSEDKNEDKNLDLRQSYFIWDRADAGYCWSGVKDKMQKRPSKPYTFKEELEPPYLLPSPDTKSFLTYQPMEDEPALFRKFADTELTKEGILDFANRYGLLARELDVRRNEREPWTTTDSFTRWENEIGVMSTFLKVWDAYRNEDKAELRKVIQWVEDSDNPSGFRLRYYRDKELEVASIDKYLDRYDIMDATAVKSKMIPGDLFMPALILIQRIINIWLTKNRIHTRLVMNEELNLEQYLMPENLLAAMWLQFLLNVSGQTDFERCDICLGWEEVSGKRSDWKYHKDCAARARARASYEKRKKADKKSVKKAPAKKKSAKKTSD